MCCSDELIWPSGRELSVAVCVALVDCDHFTSSAAPVSSLSCLVTIGYTTTSLYEIIFSILYICLSVSLSIRTG